MDGKFCDAESKLNELFRNNPYGCEFKIVETDDGSLIIRSEPSLGLQNVNVSPKWDSVERFEKALPKRVREDSTKVLSNYLASLAKLLGGAVTKDVEHRYVPWDGRGWGDASIHQWIWRTEIVVPPGRVEAALRSIGAVCEVMSCDVDVMAATVWNNFNDPFLAIPIAGVLTKYGSRALSEDCITADDAKTLKRFTGGSDIRSTFKCFARELKTACHLDQFPRAEGFLGQAIVTRARDVNATALSRVTDALE